MTFYIHIVAEGDDDLLNLLSKLTGRCEDESLGAFNGEIEFLEDGDGKGCGLAGTGLGLSDNIVTLDDGDDRTLLDGGRTFETLEQENVRDNRAGVSLSSVPVSVDTAEKFWLEIHVVETVERRSVNDVQCRAKDIKYELIDDFIPVGFNFGVWDILE